MLEKNCFFFKISFFLQFFFFYKIFKCVYFTFKRNTSLIMASSSQLKVKTIKYIILIVLGGSFIINIPYHLNKQYKLYTVLLLNNDDK